MSTDIFLFILVQIFQCSSETGKPVAIINQRPDRGATPGYYYVSNLSWKMVFYGTLYWCVWKFGIPFFFSFTLYPAYR